MKNILIIYPGFLHYRKGILDELIATKEQNFMFVGDKNGFNGIKPYQFENEADLHHVKNYRKGQFLFSKGLLKYVFLQKADGAIVHASPYWITMSLASLILKLRGIKVYNWTHGLLSDKKDLKNYFYYFYFKIFFNGLLLYGENSKKNLENIGYDSKKLHVLFNSLDYKEQIKYRNSLSNESKQKVRESLFKNPTNKQLLFIGRLTSWKKIDQLIDALALLKKDNHFVNLLIVGDGNQKTKLQQKVKSLELTELVHFYGPSYDEETNYKLIASSDCCVAPGDIGLTAMHSLMYGTPVISHSDVNSQMPEFESIKNGTNGVLFRKDDVQDLKVKILQLFEILNQSSEEAIRNKCYQIIDDIYNPKFQLEVINSVFR